MNRNGIDGEMVTAGQLLGLVCVAPMNRGNSKGCLDIQDHEGVAGRQSRTHYLHSPEMDKGVTKGGQATSTSQSQLIKARCSFA